MDWDSAQGSDDVGDLRAIVLDILSVYCVDSRRIYAEGYSSGALIAARLACDASTVFALSCRFRVPALQCGVEVRNSIPARVQK
jgi:poly(3-hydroxybutyrate) depolymerase